MRCLAQNAKRTLHFDKRCSDTEPIARIEDLRLIIARSHNRRTAPCIARMRGAGRHRHSRCGPSYHAPSATRVRGNIQTRLICRGDEPASRLGSSV